MSTTSEATGQTVKYVREKPVLASFLAAASLAGAALTLLHWAQTPWTVRAAEMAAPSAVLTTELTGEMRASAQWWPAVALLLLAVGGLLGRAVFASPLARRLAATAGWSLVVLAGLHLLENGLVDILLDRADRGDGVKSIAMALQGTAFVGYALGPATGIVTLLGALTVLLRLSSRRFKKYTVATPEPREGELAHWVHSAALPPGTARKPGGLGVCLSGGGIRSATFALGALQALQSRKSLDGGGHRELTRADYLTAVSGGAYTAGALLLAVRGRPADRSKRSVKQPVDRGFEDVLGPGSPEFDHLRRHSSYIADGWREWITAIVVVVRGALASTLLLALIAFTAGRWVGHLYHEGGRAADFEDPWHPAWGVVAATVTVLVVAAFLWILSLWTVIVPHQRLSGVLDETARSVGLAGGILVMLGAVVPIVVWASDKASQDGGLALGALKGLALGVGGVAMTALGLLHRRRSEVQALTQKMERLSQKLGDIGRRAGQWIAVYVGLTMVAAVYLTVFGYSTYVAANSDPDAKPDVRWGVPEWESPFSNIAITVGLTVVLLALYAIVDETAVGLHPFYRRRLARAFAVRRSDHDGDGRRRWTAKPYERSEVTDLEIYGDPWRRGRRLRPHVIFCAAAHCSDPDATPPGRHVLPFTISYDALGGPEVGWCPPKRMREQVSSRLRYDLTVQTAMAVSGAAFASATGAYRGPANVLLSLINARLGCWFPSPRTVADDAPAWWKARPPKIRRMSYLVREILGQYPKKGLPLTFVTDGGHYENLGIVELIRHGCREIYCFDATSDTDAFAAALGRSVALVKDEFGVTIDLRDPEAAAPRAGRPGEPEQPAGLPDLSGRLARTSTIIGTITYPPLNDREEERHGVIVIGRAVLDPGVPWEVRRHAATHPTFPQDATGDQWFDDCKFDAYTEPGRYVGGKAVDAMATYRGVAQSHPSAWLIEIELDRPAR
jgi:hypothetical protein